MSAAAEHRYQAFAAREADDKCPSANAIFLADLNALPKTDNAGRPFGDIVFVQSHGGWFAECPTTGYGFWYRTLREAVRSWRVAVFFDGGKLIGQPA
jgi:hypothetical protein